MESLSQALPGFHGDQTPPALARDAIEGVDRVVARLGQLLQPGDRRAGPGTLAVQQPGAAGPCWTGSGGSGCPASAEGSAAAPGIRRAGHASLVGVTVPDDEAGAVLLAGDAVHSAHDRPAHRLKICGVRVI